MTLLLLSGRSRALTLEPADARSQRLYLSVCGEADAERHARLIAEIEARMQDRPRAEIDATIARTHCPVCGCALVRGD
jgi:hypothetical protein